MTNPSLQLPLVLLAVLFVISAKLVVSTNDDDNTIPAVTGTCRSYCGNITIDYPFGLHPGCGHSGFRDLLYCMNGMLMLHIPSGTYRVLDIDYAYASLTLHDSSMSDCYSLSLSSKNSTASGFVVEPWRTPYLSPAPDNVFMLLGCHADSPLFQGFPGKHLPCRNISGMGCDEYYQCPAWEFSNMSPRKADSAYGSVSPPECCSLEFGAIRSINLTHLQCQGYSSAYNLAPLRARGPGEWSYGIRVSYSLPEEEEEECVDMIHRALVRCASVQVASIPLLPVIRLARWPRPSSGDHP
ncbi:uncharacterized protein A4U43_C04F400 [Asparagus officinalis]|uniref:Wall-associated receptor kinase galacturonan-binding domain-containing protein n=1 Tax=Asparagus officinalis TaxID=4686 RepID=A0A5P1F1M0_ASPOF|nr:uncharacterized protein A4U43_C04F400 [Asparagus officinalis]